VRPPAISPSDVLCDDDLSVANGVFYEVIGTGSGLVASTCHPSTSFQTEISVRRSGCTEGDCDIDAEVAPCGNNDGKMVYWFAEQGASYIVVVHGSEESIHGVFALTIEQQLLLHDRCFLAQEVSVPSSTLGSTEYASTDTETTTIGACGLQSPLSDSSRGLWYVIEGTGSVVTVNTCSRYTNFDTQLVVYEGPTCSELRCQAADEDSCNQRSSVTWMSAVGERYWILVQGYGAVFGDFELIITDGL
jgi:hypothetical protein